jgi:hypothetical protein
VFYEIGLRHMAQKPILHMHEQGQRIPFDVSLYRSIKYSRVRPRDIKAACNDLIEAVRSIHDSGYRVENPVTRALGKIEFERHASPKEKIVASEIEGMKLRIEELEEMVLDTINSLPRPASKLPEIAAARNSVQSNKLTDEHIRKLAKVFNHSGRVVKFTNAGDLPEEQFRDVVSHILNSYNLGFTVDKDSSADAMYISVSKSAKFDMNRLAAEADKHNVIVRYD